MHSTASFLMVHCKALSSPSFKVIRNYGLCYHGLREYQLEVQSFYKIGQTLGIPIKPRNPGKYCGSRSPIMSVYVQIHSWNQGWLVVHSARTAKTVSKRPNLWGQYHYFCPPSSTTYVHCTDVPLMPSYMAPHQGPMKFPLCNSGWENLKEEQYHHICTS